MLRALAEGRLLADPGREGDYEIEVTSGGPFVISSRGGAGARG